jgi:hypothetical protein
MRVQFGTGYDTWNAKGRKPHRLRAVKGRVLKGGNPDQSVDEPGGKSRTWDIDLIRQHGLDTLGQWPGDEGFRPTPGR